jgi:hypothetical protein
VTDARRAPDVDYLTRDYDGFRTLLVSLLDRIAQRALLDGSVVPWTERAAGDLGMTVVEILANQLDHLGYAGDRVAEEAFLGTARQRESARRHAALGDHRLDRGNATSGFQHFELAAGAVRDLVAGTRVGHELQFGDDPERRVAFETTADARLDARLGQLALARSAAAGEVWLHLRTVTGARFDLRAAGVRSGMRFCVLDRERGQGELVVAQRVQGDAIALADPLGDTYLASATMVIGNLVPVRRGRTGALPAPDTDALEPAPGAWEDVATGGAARGEVRDELYFARRIDGVRRLRDAAEAAREAWIGDPSLAGWWELASAEVAAVVRELRASGGAPTQPERDALDARLSRAAELLRELLRASGFAVPRSLGPSARVAIPNQKIALPGEPPDLWLDGATMLRVRVDDAGRITPWLEQDDLLRSGPDDPHYVVEIDARGAVTLRFGDGANGALLPPDGRVQVQRVRGDLFGGDLGAGALDALPQTIDPAIVATTNPLPTAGARSPELLGEPLVRKVRDGLVRRAIPVTVDDYHAVLLEEIADLAEVSVAIVATGERVVSRRVDIVIRPRPGIPPAPVLAAARALVRTARLAGTDAWVRMYEPLFVSIAVIVEVHPELTAADVRLRVRRALLAAFGGDSASELGRVRSRAEIHRVAEAVPGVVYSQVVGFDLANVPIAALAVNEEIRAGRHQVVRCLGLPDNPLCGDVVTWAARRYRLQVELGYPDPDERPDTEVVLAMLTTLLSGVDARPARERWPALTAARIDAALASAQPRSATYQLTVRAIVVGERVVDRLPLGDGELAILDGVQLRDRPFHPHFRLALSVTGAAPPDLLARLRARLSGPASLPVRDRWSELTPRLLEGVVARELGPGVRLVSLALRIGERGVERIALAPGDVPVLDAVTVQA